MSRRSQEGLRVINKTRVFIGIVLIIAALIIAVYLIPRYIASRQALYPILILKKDVALGTVLCDSDITVSKTSDKTLADVANSDTERVVGKAATRQLFAGRYLFYEDVAESSVIPTIYNTLPEGHLLISISTPSLASSAAGQIRANDIIRFYSLDENGSVNTPSELQYVKVLAVYDSKGYELNSHSATRNDSNLFASNGFFNSSSVSSSSQTFTSSSSSREEHSIPAVISLLVTQKQALRLVQLERIGGHYISLVSRGKDELESKLLRWQADVLDSQSKGMSG